MKNKYTERQKEKDTNIVEFVECRHLNLNHAYQDVQQKLTFLKVGMNYKNLKVNGGKYAPIEDCSYARVNAVVRDTYRAAKKRLKEDELKGLEGEVDKVEEGWLFRWDLEVKD